MFFAEILEPLQLGNVMVQNRIVLAPMAGVTDRPFRVLCKRMGCGLLVSEMVSAKGLTYKNERTRELLLTDVAEQPFAVQLFGSEPQIMSEAASMLEQSGVQLLDINMGCPVPKVVNAGEGSALMKDPGLAGAIVAAVVKAVKIPVMVKIRKGWNTDKINCVELARIAEQNGAVSVAVHARTRMQFYSGAADWNAIAAVKKSVSIPVIGNGDIFNARAAVRMMQETGCDAVMIGRGAMGNPWIFRNIIAYAESGCEPEAPTAAERFGLLNEQLMMLAELKGEKRAVQEMRGHAAWYTKGLRYSARLRQHFNKAVTIDDFKTVFDQLAGQGG